MAGYAVINNRPRVLFEDHSAVTTSTPVVSGFLKLNKTTFILTKTNGGGTYGLALDWSMDGTNVVFATTSAPSNNTPTTISALAPYVRFTVSASGSNLSAHQTTLMI